MIQLGNMKLLNFHGTNVAHWGTRGRGDMKDKLIILFISPVICPDIQYMYPLSKISCETHNRFCLFMACEVVLISKIHHLFFNLLIPLLHPFASVSLPWVIPPSKASALKFYLILSFLGSPNYFS